MSARGTVLGGLLLSALISISCNCRWFETMEQLQGLFDESDAVFVGRVVRIVSPGWRGLHDHSLGANVLMKVLSAQKGLLRGDTVLVLQASGNCDRAFRHSQELIVFGHTFTRVAQLTEQDSLREAGVQAHASVFYLAPPDSGAYRPGRSLVSRYRGVATSQCVTFATSKLLPAAFIRAKSQR